MNEYLFSEIEIGKEESFTVVCDQKRMDLFRMVTGDSNPLHCEDSFAKEEGFQGCVAYGLLVSSFYSTLAGVYLPGKWSLIYDVQIGMTAPVYVDDVLTIKGKVIEKEDAYRLITIRLQIVNQEGKRVSQGKMRVLVRK